jgi:NADPH:quinone reductase-like Zn-dependent oxidoreductase
VAVAASDVAAKPQSLDYVHAAALPHVVLTAWQALIEEARLEPGQTVLVHGAAGGVGHVAVQLAHLHGARVVGTASINLELLQELDVDEEINYSEAPFEDVVGAVDVVLDTVGGDTQERSWSLLKPGGILLSTVQAPSEETAAAHGVRHRMIAMWPPIGPTLTEVAELVDHGDIRPVVSLVLPLEDIRKAHTLIEGRHTRGKIAPRTTVQ